MKFVLFFFLLWAACFTFVKCTSNADKGLPVTGNIEPLYPAGLQDYQLQYHYDTLQVWNGSRLVGTHIDTSSEGYFHGAFIDSLIMADNL